MTSWSGARARPGRSSRSPAGSAPATSPARSATTGSRSESPSRSWTTSSTAWPRRGETGKTPGADLRDGVPTVPLLLAAERDERVRAALAGGIVRWSARASGGVRGARALARDRPRIRPRGLRAPRRARPRTRARGARAGGRGENEMSATAQTERRLARARAREGRERRAPRSRRRRRPARDGRPARARPSWPSAPGGCAAEATRPTSFAISRSTRPTSAGSSAGSAPSPARPGRRAPTRSAPTELAEDARQAFELEPFSELHLVNGESPQVDFDWYLETVRALREALPGVHLKCYSASEIHHISTLSGLSYEQVLDRAEGGRAGLAHRRRRRGLLAAGAQADRARQGAGRGLARGEPGRPLARDPEPLHDPLRPRRDDRGASRSPAPPARAPGRDGRLPRLRPARRPSREHPARPGRRLRPHRRRRPRR